MAIRAMTVYRCAHQPRVFRVGRRRLALARVSVSFWADHRTLGVCRLPITGLEGFFWRLTSVGTVGWRMPASASEREQAEGQ